jgi:hypothetical protein
LSSWSCMQRKSALAQHHSAPNSAMAALAAAGMGQCGFAGGLHPAVEAMDLAGLFAGGPLSPDAAGGSSSVGSGLGDPSSWSTVIPVHLLPMVSQVCGQFQVDSTAISRPCRSSRAWWVVERRLAAVIAQSQPCLQAGNASLCCLPQ